MVVAIAVPLRMISISKMLSVAQSGNSGFGPFDDVEAIRCLCLTVLYGAISKLWAESMEHHLS